jgi:hypothetical protein
MGALPIITATKVSRQAQLPAAWAPFAPAYPILSLAGLVDGMGGEETYGDDQHAAEDAGCHYEDSAGEEDEEFEFLAQGEARFEEDLSMLDGDRL